VISRALVSDDRFGSSPQVVEVNALRSLATLGVKQDWWRQTSRHLVKWGLDIRHVEAAYDYTARPAVGSSTAIARAPRGQEVGVYAADQWRVSRRLDVEIGLRWDRHTYTPERRSAPDPRVNAVYAIGPRTVVRAGWGLFSQAQKIHELQVEDGVDRFVPPERAEHRLFSVAQELAGGVRAEVHAYQKRVGDLSPRFENLFQPFGFFPEAAHDRVRIAADAARADGLELVVQRPTRVSTGAGEGRRRVWPTGWRAAYSLARAEDRVDGRWAPRAWDQRHALNAGIDWTPAPGWDLTFAATAHSGRPTTPVIGTLAAGVDRSSAFAPLFGPRNSARLPAYARADLRIGRSLTIRGSDLRATLTVTDLVGRGAACCIAEIAFHPQPDGTMTVARQLRDEAPRLVSFGIRWRF
jgi:outer membrane receptor protein involved in Fe transport